MSNLIFKLSMPGRSSWNGRWSGEENIYAIVKPIGRSAAAQQKADALISKRYFSHSWSDGWRASIEVTEADSAEVRRIRKHSKGFCGYDWMVENILDHGDTREKKDGQLLQPA